MRIKRHLLIAVLVGMCGLLAACSTPAEDAQQTLTDFWTAYKCDVNMDNFSYDCNVDKISKACETFTTAEAIEGVSLYKCTRILEGMKVLEPDGREETADLCISDISVNDNRAVIDAYWCHAPAVADTYTKVNGVEHRWTLEKTDQWRITATCFLKDGECKP